MRSSEAGLGKPERVVPAWRQVGAFGDALRASSLVLFVLAVYYPALSGGFVWDDDLHLLNNPVFREGGLARAWFTTENVFYRPLFSTSFWIEHQLWGFRPFGYHLVNMLIHASSSVLLWRVLRRLNVPLPYFCALLFAIHPVNVESVAWITQRKNVLSMLFFLGSALCFLRFDDSGRRAALWTSVLSFLLAMLSKGAAVGLPAVLLLCIWWRHGSVRRSQLTALLPFVLVAVVMSGVEIFFESERSIGHEVVRADSFASRLAGSGWVVWFYISKAVLPVGLSFIYPRWAIDATSTISYLPGLLVAGVVAVAWHFRMTWGRPVLFAALYTLAMLAPVLGFFDIYFMKYSLVADHYQYLSIIGVIALLTGFVWKALERFGPVGAKAAMVLALAIPSVLGWMTWQRAGIYRNNETLWQDTTSKNPDSFLARHNYGLLLMHERRFQAAERQLLESVRIRPGAAHSRSALGGAVQAQGRYEDAEEHYRAALRIDPRQVTAHVGWGNGLSERGMFKDAISHFRAALRINPCSAKAHYALASVFLERRREQDALKHFELATVCRPPIAEAHESLAALLRRRGQVRLAEQHERKAARLRSSPRRRF